MSNFLAPYPDPAPVIDAVQHILQTGSKFAVGGTDPRSGADCYTFVSFCMSLAGVQLPDDPAQAEVLFRQVAPPYRPWDVLLCRFASGIEPRHMLLLLAPTWGFHCSINTNGVARFVLHRAFWRQHIQHGWRFKEWD